MLVTLLTSRIAALLYAVFAVLLLIVAGWQAVQIHGLHVPFVGWTLSEGLESKAADTQHVRDLLATSQKNNAKLQTAIDTQNAAIQVKEQADADAIAAANAALKKARDGNVALQTQLDKVNASKIDTTSCPSFVTSIEEAIQEGIQ